MQITNALQYDYAFNFDNCQMEILKIQEQNIIGLRPFIK